MKLKRIFAILLAVILMLGIVPSGALMPIAAAEEMSGETVDGAYSITVSGGTATFVGKTAAFNGTANANDVLELNLTEQDGRVFKYWKSIDGTKVADKSFRILVACNDWFYAVFEDTDDSAFDVWTVEHIGNCEEGIVSKSVNAKGDVKYKVEYVNGGQHSFGEAHCIEDGEHEYICSVCGVVKTEKHYWNSETTKLPTHVEEGITTYTCAGCGVKRTEAIPMTNEHELDDEWIIVEKSENGQYGKRMKKCKYCDYSETYWYLESDFEASAKNNYVYYETIYGGKATHKEHYYSYTNDVGQNVYIWALQYNYALSSNNDYGDTYIFMFIDDENPNTLKPVYLSKNSGEVMGGYLWAVYGYVYDFCGWESLLDSPDLDIGCNDSFDISNSMSARASSYQSWSDRWALSYNEMMIPVTSDPNSFITTTGEFKKWEVYYEGKRLAGSFVDSNRVIEAGGIDCIEYRRRVSDTAYEYVTVDKNTGVTIDYTDQATYYTTINRMMECKSIVEPAMYSMMGAPGKAVSYSYENIENDIRNFCESRRSFPGFTLNVPEEHSAFRFLVSGNAQLSGSNASYLYNPARIFRSGNEITLTWTAPQGYAFDRYEKWNFETQEWELLSTEPTCVVNTYENPITDTTYVRAIDHELPVSIVTYTVTVVNGYFVIGDDYEHGYTSAEVPENSTIYCYSDYIDGKDFDVWENQAGETYSSGFFTVTEDMTLTAKYVDAVYFVGASTYNGVGNISVDGGEASDYQELRGTAGTTFALTTTPAENSEHDEFLGWYLESYGKNGCEYTLLDKNTSISYTITGWVHGNIVAVWTDGTVSLEEKTVTVRVIGGFANTSGAVVSVVYGNVGSPAGYTAVSAMSATSYSNLSLYDDPTDSICVTAWEVVYNDEAGEQRSIVNIDPESEYPALFFVEHVDTYVDGVITIRGISEGECAENEHEWDEGVVTTQPMCFTPGVMTYTCIKCNAVKTEEIPAFGSHLYRDEWDACNDPDNHVRYCERCKEPEYAPHTWDDGVVTTEPTCGSNGVKTYICTACGEVKTEEIEATGCHHMTDWMYSDNMPGQRYRCCTECSFMEVEDYIPEVIVKTGDANGDGSVNLTDALLILRFLSEWSVTFNADAADVNGDGSVNQIDAILILRYFAGWEVAQLSAN